MQISPIVLVNTMNVDALISPIIVEIISKV
jgi:hypothetical protein